MKRLLIFLALASLPALAQTTKINPDCDIQFTFTGGGSSAVSGCGQNTQGVTFWHMIYQASGFSGLTITVQHAPDSAGSPGSWTTFTAATGSNPSTNTTGLGADSTYTGFAPWVRVTLSGLTGSGTVAGHLYGCRTPGCGGPGPSAGGGGGSPAGTTGCIQINLSGSFACPGAATVVASLPSAAANAQAIYLIDDGTSATDCTTGGGSDPVLCYSTGSAWTNLSGSSGGGTPGGSTDDIQFKTSGGTFGGGRCSMDSSQNIVCAGQYTAGSGAGLTGALDLIGKTSSATSTITVDDSNSATTLKLPNDGTSGLYFVSSPTATPSAGCAEFNGTSTQAVSTGTACGGGGGSGNKITFGTFASFPATPTTGDLFYPSDSPHMYGFGASSWVAYNLFGIPLTQFVPGSGYTWHNQNSWTISTVDEDPILTCTTGCTDGSSTDQIVHYQSNALLTIPYTYTVHLVPLATPTSAGNMAWGITVKDTVSGKVIEWGWFTPSSSTPGYFMEVVEFNSETSVSAGVTPNGQTTNPGYGIWLRIQNNVTNRIFSYSVNGVDWQPVVTQSAGTFITENATGVSIYEVGNNAVAGSVRVDSLKITNP